MANGNQNTAQNAKADKTPPKAPMKVTRKIDWTENGLRVTVSVLIMADRAENQVGREVEFYDPANFKKLKRTKSDKKGKAFYTYEILTKDFKPGTKKVGVMVMAKIGDGTKSIIKRFTEDIEVEQSLPAGSLRKGVQTAIIRQDKHYADFFRATTLIALFIAYVYYVGNTKFSFFVAGLSLLIVYLWWRRSKSIFRTTFCAIMMMFSFISLTISPATFSIPLIRGSVLSLLLGMPAYLAEEIHRKPDGKSVRNYYPAFPIAICLLAILFNAFSVMGHFMPSAETEISIQDPNAFLNVGTSWTFLNNLPFLSRVDFQGIASNLDWLFSFFVAGTILLFYGGTGDLIDWYKASKSGEKPDVGAGGFVGILAILKQGFDIVKDVILPWVGPFGKGRK